MKQIFEAVRAALSRGEDVVLCSILASSGSAPRGAGAKMAVFADGTTAGTVGGGAVEQHTQRLAMQVHETKQPVSHGFCLAPNQVNDIGMICGGNVTVYFQLLTADDLPLVEALLAALDSGENVWLVLQLADGCVRETGLYDEKNGLRFTDCLTAEALAPMLRSRAVYSKGEPGYYVEPVSRAGMVYIFGGGHVGRALVPELARVGFRVTVFDNRPDFSTKAAHPAAEDVILGDYYHISEKVVIGPEDYVVIMTPGHQADREVLLQAMRTDATYIGCIGSRHKIAATQKYLMENGIPQLSLARIHSPIGLAIQAETPEEIAVSITAELILHRALHAQGAI